jgi:hypothetical protein
MQSRAGYRLESGSENWRNQQFAGSISLTERPLRDIFISSSTTAIVKEIRMNRRTFIATMGAVGATRLTPSLMSSTVKPSDVGGYPPIPSNWTGSNPSLKYYSLYPGYPAYDPHPRYLGELSGSWKEIGEQYGKRAGDLIRMVFEGWFFEVVEVQRSTENLRQYLRQQEQYYKLLLPEALELMVGVAMGAKDELDKSAYAGLLSHYDKILMINSYWGLKGAPPGTPAKNAKPTTSDSEGEVACSGAVIFGKATADGKAIHCSSEDQHFFPQEYLVTYTVHPDDKNAHSYTVTASAGEIGSEHALNDHGVVVSGYAGGGGDIASPTLAAPFSGYRRPGLDWQLACWYGTAFADSAQKAVEILTVGRPEFQKKSGFKIVVGKCTKGANWVVSDKREAFVVESIPADLNGIARYGVRRPGDLGEAGDYIVSTNNVEANQSYNEQNVREPNHPMSQHGSGFSKPVYGLDVNGGSGTRFMTYTWLIKNNYGRITPEMVKTWRTAHYVYDRSAKRHDRLEVVGHGPVSPHLVPGVTTLCAHSKGPAGSDPFTGSNIYVSLSVSQDLTVYRTKGRPCEWVGPWDVLTIKS